MKPYILVIDDNVAICELLNDVLSEHVFTVYTCHQGYEGLSLHHHPDIALVLLDLVLPNTNGLLVLHQLQRPDLLVIMLNGLGAESDIVVGLEMGADDYIAKPFTPRFVVARAKAVLRRARAGLPRRLRGRPVVCSMAGGWMNSAAPCLTPSGRRFFLPRASISFSGYGAARPHRADPRPAAGVDPQ